jgi:tetratricopeptide (TPR) repeat protein
MAAIEQGNWAEAEWMMAQAVESCPVDGVAREHYAETLWQRGAKTEALEQIEEAIRLRGDDPVLEVRAAEMLLALDQPDRAGQHVRRALVLDPQSARAWLVVGKLKVREGKPQEALAYFHRALVDDPNSRDVLKAIAELHVQLGEPQRALVNWQALADTFTAGDIPPDVLLALGEAYHGTRRYDDAIASFGAARERGAPPADVCRHLAQTWYAAGRLDLADRAAQEALALERSSAHGGELAVRPATAPQTPLGQGRSGPTALR